MTPYIPALMNRKMHGKQIEGIYNDITGLEYIDKVIGIDQQPIGRTPDLILLHILEYLPTSGSCLLRLRRLEQEGIRVVDSALM